MRNACDSDSRCGLACDASARDAKSLAMWVERCKPLSQEQNNDVSRFAQQVINMLFAYLVRTKEDKFGAIAMHSRQGGKTDHENEAHACCNGG